MVILREENENGDDASKGERGGETRRGGKMEGSFESGDGHHTVPIAGYRYAACVDPNED